MCRFISVSNALPKTSYVKMVDIWLLFNLVMPFAEVGQTKPLHGQVLLQTYIEHLRGLVEQTKTINHHGKEVKVDLADDIDTENDVTEDWVLNIKP